MLETIIDNKSDDKPSILKQVLCHYDWPKWKKTMKVEYDSLIENETWELIAISKNW